MFSVNPSRSIAGISVSNNANENISNNMNIPPLAAGATGAALAAASIGVVPMLPPNSNSGTFMPPAMQPPPIHPASNFPVAITAATTG